MKLLGDSVYAANVAMVDQALEHAVRLGMDKGAVVEVFDPSGAASFSLTMLTIKIHATPPSAGTSCGSARTTSPCSGRHA
jgi:3-hydroxyisobutyrate dehydrogenase-like beta-hydroxyacid dehydrogenase